MRLFLYGTLQAASDTPMARWLASRIDETLRASVPGRLVAIPACGGWFPALMRGSPAGRCHGTLVRATLRASDLVRLDRYEGREYRRAIVRTRVEGNRALSASVYVWRDPLPPGAVAIPGGDFLAWLDRTGRRAFTTMPGRA